ncbi:MAG: stress response translation initiation inhibitor YciH [Candidatus Woesearchaeota archaeon]
MSEICEICGLPKELCVCGNIAKEELKLTVSVDQRRFKKLVTLIEGFTDDKSVNIEELLRYLKKKLGCGGVIRENNVIELQGNHLSNIKKLLVDYGFDENNIVIKK